MFADCRTGYKMCLRVYLNGDGIGRGTHLSIFFVVMRGQYDALLPWPFRQKISLFLLNQCGNAHITDAFQPDTNSSSFRRPTTDMNIASGCPKFALHSVLDPGSDFLREDKIFIRAVVDTRSLQNEVFK